MHGEAQLPIRQSVEWVRDTVCELCHLLHQEQKIPAKQTQRWSRPQEGWFKCNADGAFLPDARTGAVGAVLPA